MEIKKIELPFKARHPVLAVGSQLKNTVCLVKGNLAYLSPVHPDLSNPKDFSLFFRFVKYFLKKNPRALAYDMHPEYQSTKYALGLDAKRYTLAAVQHHHAHIASCMAENGLKNQKVIGVAFDGTGLGSNNQLWGAEFLICSYKNFKRAAHLKEVALLGGERAILEPWRLSAFWLYGIFGDGFLKLKIDFVKRIERKKWRVLKKMYLSGFNSPLASSMGRLFDAAAGLILARYEAEFEAELAIELEKLASGFGSIANPYSFKIIKNKDGYIIEPSAIFKQIIQDLKKGEHKQKIAFRFHLTVAQMINKACLILRKDAQINKVALSGGVFQNNLLLRQTLDLLYKGGFRVFTHQKTSCNDSGISLGQAAIANFSGS